MKVLADLRRLIPMNYKVSYKRHLAKTISYRILSTTVGFLIMWWATGSIEWGAAFGVAELIYKPIQYYIHERVWYRWIKFGLVPEKKDATKIVLEDLVAELKKPTPPPTKMLYEGENPNKKVLKYKPSR